MTSNQTNQLEPNNYLNQIHGNDFHVNMQLENNFDIEVEHSKSQIEEDDEEDAIQHSIQHNFKQTSNLNSQRLSQRGNSIQEKFLSSCNLPALNTNFTQQYSVQNSDSTQIGYAEREQQSNENSICQTFVTFQERPRSDSQNLQTDNRKNKQFSKQDMQNYNDQTMINEATHQQWQCYSENLVQNSFDANSTNQSYFAEKATNKNILSQHDSMEDETSSLSNSQPAKKQKKAISKVSGSPQSGSLQTSLNKIVNRKKSNTINTSIFSTTSQKRERNQYLQLQKEMLNFNNSDIIQQFNKLEENTINNNNNTSTNANNNNSDTSEDDVNEDVSNNIDKKLNEKDKKSLKQSQISGQNNENQSKKVRFTAEEDEALIKLIQIHGKKWKVISELMDGKNETRIRNRYYSYIRKILKPEDATPTLTANDHQQEEYAFEQINLRETAAIEQNNPESFQEFQQTNKSGSNIKNDQNAVKNNGTQELGYQEESNNQIDKNQSGQKDQKLNENLKDQFNSGLQQSTQQNNTNQPFYNSTLFESLNALTLNNFDKNFNSAFYDANFADNQNYHNNNFLSNQHDSLLVQSYNQLCQFPFSSNNLNFDHLNSKIPSFKCINGFEGSLANLDAGNQMNFGKQSYLYNNQKSSLQDFEAIDAEDYNQKFYRVGKESNPIFSSEPVFQEDENLNQQNKNNKPQDSIQNFCPNKILRSLNEKNHFQEEPSPLIFAKVQQRYDPKRFANVNPDQAFNTNPPVSNFSMEEETDEENKKQIKIIKNNNNYGNINEERGFSMSDNEKIQKIMYLNSQVENIQTLISQCKQQILNEILYRNKTNV